MESLFQGAYQLVADEVGMNIQSQMSEKNDNAKEKDRQFALRWINSFSEDPDVGADSRMMVPVFYDMDRREIKVWIFLGYSLKPLKIWFEKRPQVRVTDADGKTVEYSTESGFSSRGSSSARIQLEFDNIWRPLLTPISAEVYVKKLLDRDEFRALCDKYKTQSAILSALKNQNLLKKSQKSGLDSYVDQYYSSDQQVHADIQNYIGSWEGISSKSPIHGLTILKSDGTYRTTLYIKEKVILETTGRWFIRDNKFVWTYDRDMGPYRKGEEDVNLIVKYENDKFVLQEWDGSFTTFIRKK